VQTGARRFGLGHVTHYPGHDVRDELRQRDAGCCAAARLAASRSIRKSALERPQADPELAGDPSLGSADGEELLGALEIEASLGAADPRSATLGRCHPWSGALDQQIALELGKRGTILSTLTAPQRVA